MLYQQDRFTLLSIVGFRVRLRYLVINLQRPQLGLLAGNNIRLVFQLTDKRVGSHLIQLLLQKQLFGQGVSACVELPETGAVVCLGSNLLDFQRVVVILTGKHNSGLRKWGLAGCNGGIVAVVVAGVCFDLVPSLVCFVEVGIRFLALLLASLLHHPHLLKYVLGGRAAHEGKADVI